ncbi:hypothetical protein [Flavobacterium daejeonense]|uniref:hypothetical protein n=1 Tax=Flavobacterium daejeonense TaxID=350893 RepID=UPI000B0A40A6|nr:hypothetical protein [Flavobacterium daejeonense]
MTYISSIEQVLWVKKFVKLIFYEVLFGIIIFLFFSFMMYLKANSPLFLFIGVFGLAVFLFIYAYGSVVNKCKIINHTISKIKFENKNICIETFAYKTLFKKRDSILIDLDVSAIKFRNDKYPILDKNITKYEVLFFLINDKEFYLVLDFFDKDLANKLKSFND